MPRLPRKVGRRHWRPSVPQRAQARHQSQPSTIRATLATRNESECDQVPHTCHAKRRWMSPSATPATRNLKVDVAKCQSGSDQVPRLPRRTQVDVDKCHSHAKRRWMSPSATTATQSWAASLATKRAPARPSAPPEPAQYHKCHACHAKRSPVP